MKKIFPQLLLYFLVAASISQAAMPQLKSQVEVTITAADYCQFLNAVARTDSQNLYDEKMESDLAGACVTRAGEPGRYRYANQAEGCRLEDVGPETATVVTLISYEDAAHYCNWKGSVVPSFNAGVDQQLKSNQLIFNLINIAASSGVVQSSSNPGATASSWKEEVEAALLVIAMIGGGGDESQASEGSEFSAENSGQDPSPHRTFNGMNIRKNQNPISDTLRTDMAATAATAETAPEGRFNNHDIRAIAPNIDSMSEVIGVHPQLVLDWVSAGLRNDTTAQETTLHQIVQIIKKRTGTMSDNDLADLKNDLANRALEAQGRPIVPKKEASSTKYAGDDLQRLQVTEELPTTAGSTRRDVLTSTAGLLNALQKLDLGHLVSDFLVSDPATQKKEVQQKYTEALNDLSVFSREIADAMAQEPVPKTEEEAQAFKTKYERLLQASASKNTSASKNAESLAQLKERVTRVCGLKAALNVLDVVTDYRNRFLGTLANSTDSQKASFYYKQINNIDKTVQNLQRAAASILETTESIITNAARWREAVVAGHSKWLDHYFNGANRHAAESIRLNIQYAEAIRAGDHQTARDLAQEAQRHARQSELLYSGVDSSIRNPEASFDNCSWLESRWDYEAEASFRVADAAAAGNQPVAELYTQAATYHRNVAEATRAKNHWLAISQWKSAAHTSFRAAAATEAGNQPLAELCIQEATYWRKAAEATLANDKPLAKRWENAGYASFQAVIATEAGNQPLAELYTQAATYWRKAAEATRANDEPLAKRWHNAAEDLLEAAQARRAGRNADADRFAAEAEAIVRSIGRTWREWVVQTFLPGSK